MRIRNHPVVSRPAPLVFAACMLSGANGSPSLAQQISSLPRPELWIADDDVYCHLLTPCTLCAWGALAYVGPCTGSCVAIGVAFGGGLLRARRVSRWGNVAAGVSYWLASATASNPRRACRPESVVNT